MAVTFASALKYTVPSWLSSGDGGLALTAVCNVLDDYADRVRQGLQARFPSRAGDDALALIGADRGLIRGITETSPHYAARLRAWRYPRGHLVRGSAFALLAQVSNYFGAIDCYTIDIAGTQFKRTAAGVETFTFGVSWTWDTDVRKGRFWVLIVPGAAMTAQPSLGTPTLWGGALGTPGFSVGQLGATPDDADAMRGLFTASSPWNPAGTLPMWLIVALDGTVAHTPDATWAHWSKNVGGTQVASRYAGWRYWPLTAGVNDYTGDRTNPASTTTLTSGATYTGVRASAVSTVTLSSGATYSGVRSRAVSKVTLIDDGGVPV